MLMSFCYITLPNCPAHVAHPAIVYMQPILPWITCSSSCHSLHAAHPAIDYMQPIMP